MIHVYTGNGKGKTTSAIGLSIRTAGYGKKVLFTQFVKDMEYSEIKILKTILNIEYKRYGKGCFISRDPDDEDIQLIKNGLKEIKDLIEKNDYMLVVLDEVNIALKYNLLTLEDLKFFFNIYKDNLNKDLVLTGRYAPEELIEIADLVTEMKEIKHYFNDGILARDGIER
ncbi:MAG TPA: cob(I)yrinic acid a,c-diamide adenosyltransferase [Ignavibacteriales bacterium]|mgnify:CR=1 FL=1|nr:cob(I)yrinic acid a,c-diamide adenosyltransferase [Ignavibacteriales bacterium]HOM65320.1 cob(I)yrinic acid a,c-diamide adenosyltransferase [Ignavibacteriales bacterium]HPD68092.1 cob(I)yrinic acid a,c-diamide adenosyltransferase [Ignavibacteriales bacterium]HPP34560.1 cob(I)yrinic acid a,c-diamide adenosyltransferase [Ignavibacteriales bacterium]HRR18341.1 cob(I)yrinic acid a,c-diamide adenosyltransferase [Ignavibacteriales bacterium]